MSVPLTENDFKKLCAENFLLKQALEDIANPIAALQRDTPIGYGFDGQMAVHIVSRPEHYQKIARDTLDKVKRTP